MSAFAAGKAMTALSNNALRLTYAEAVKGINELSKSALRQTCVEVVKGIDESNKKNLRPTLENTGQAVDGLSKSEPGPALEVAGKALDEPKKTEIILAVKEMGERAAPIAERVGDFARENPGKVVLIAGSALAVAVPMLVAAPILGVFGFGAEGIIAGSVAAGAQAGMGSVAAGGLFATLQSAAMGGYGVAAVGGVVQAGGAILGAIGLFGGAKKGDEETASSASEEAKNECKELGDEEDLIQFGEEERFGPDVGGADTKEEVDSLL